MARRVGLFGGLVLLMAATASAQPPGGGRGFGGGFPQSAAMLLSIEEVRTELATDDVQNEKIVVLTDDLRSRMRESEGSAEERRAEAEEIGKEADAAVARILKPEQRTRLHQLFFQREGVSAISRPAVAEKLALTEDQKKKVSEIVAAGRPQSGASNFRDMTDEQRREYYAQMQERRTKTETELLAVLTEEQKKTWTGLQGEKFTFPERRGGGGRRQP